MRWLLAIALCTAALAQTTYAPGTTPFTSSSRSEGGIYSTQGFNNVVAYPSSDGPVRWTGNHTLIDVSYYAAANSGSNAGSGATICLYNADAPTALSLIGSCIVGAGDGALHTSSGQWTGLSGTHTYELVNVGTNAGGSVATNGYLNIITGVIVNGGTGLGSQPALKPLIVACGDSITGYQSSSIFDSRLGDWWQIAGALGFSDIHFAEYGALVTGTIKTDCPNVVGNAISSGQPASAYAVANESGVNDANGAVTLGSPGVSCTTGTFECDYYNMLASEWSKSPTNVYARGILPNSYTTSGSGLAPNIATYNAGMLAAVSQWNADNPTKHVTYYSTVGWFDPVAGTVADHLHPTQASYTAMQNCEIPVFANLGGSNSFSLSGPSTGTAGTPSANFTIALVSGANFGACGVTLTPSDGAAGGSFTPASLTPTSGTTATFTYTAASSGAKTITVAASTNSGYTAPSGITYTASAVPPTITTTTLPNGSILAAYSATVATTGTPVITCSITSGSLPAGLSLTGCAITGTPTAAGAASFTVTASNVAGSAGRAYAINITGSGPASVLSGGVIASGGIIGHEKR